ncbi:MAG TPA: hypothetical protein VFO05_06625 [Candidatus Limnocylindrales bacterium]|nr:hypothetical protein [Candidatus Limnocylindrales bacterium]
MERTKRTYRISTRAQARVRELASRYGIAASQDAVVETAIERLYREVEAHAEADAWATAAGDAAFRAETAAIAALYDDTDTWPG